MNNGNILVEGQGDFLGDQALTLVMISNQN